MNLSLSILLYYLLKSELKYIRITDLLKQIDNQITHWGRATETKEHIRGRGRECLSDHIF